MFKDFETLEVLQAIDEKLFSIGRNLVLLVAMKKKKSLKGEDDV